MPNNALIEETKNAIHEQEHDHQIQYDFEGIKTGIPGGSSAPKRPLSPFIFYSQDARRLIKKTNPQLHSKQIMKIVQKNWRQMSEVEKERYKDQSKVNRNQYEEKRREFDSIKMQDPDTTRLNVIQGI